MITPEIQSLIIKSLEETLPPSESAQLGVWLGTDNNKIIYRDLTEVWQASGELDYKLLEVDSEEALRQVKSRIKSEKSIPISKPKSTRTFLMAACFAMVALGLGYFSLNYTTDSSDYMSLLAEENTSITLPDNSKVWLNEGSTIKYATDFASNRAVILEGTAMFDVTHNPTRPFTIKAPKMDITVLGTQFIVGNDTRDKDYVSVLEGKVQVEDRINKKTKHILTKNMAVYRNEDTLIASDKIPNALFWATGKLSFSEVPITTVFDELEKYYKVTITPSKNLAKCKFSGTFSDQDLSQIIGKLELIYNFSVEYKNAEELVISGGSC